MRVFEDFHKNHFLDWRLNTIFISLIPKEKGNKKVKDYFPLLQYADDLMVFIDGTLEEARTVREILRWFEFLSGLAVNCEKLVLFEVNKVVQSMEMLSYWCCNAGNFPDTYLGMPLGARCNSISVWDGLMDRVWKTGVSSKDGFFGLGLDVAKDPNYGKS